MALSRKKWNTIIILASILMISVLTVIERNSQQTPMQTQALFDKSAPLSQLQYGEFWLQKRQSGWQCSERVLNCLEWANAWEQVHISALADKPETSGEPIELVIQVEDLIDAQLWIMFSEQGLLKSPAGNWYQIPPSLRESLKPIIRAQAN
ncbi:hypothetical protein L2719_10545 [Shewanella schlegeliana]|uniref:DUF2509 family protein n=1 Tax=Shewanella schlegeliana TaxID=190308 RepID=A0ABS1T1L6_9GAMM|nr:hypothetical protein [Shewanella schlegeliana]MBL4914681.1 hypothetical protein [Shewanella schlegeliana]MCL1109987.1 hypothetical protein [Shewanella schlegeliana]GIU25344.1 hypothetical protein TUM4433_10000 [Shewanella schlegeliana]